MHVTQWVPAADSPRWPCVLSWLNTNIPGGCGKSFVRSGPNNVKYSWNRVVQDFLKSESDWLWSTHNDVMYDPGTLTRLLSWDKPLISALVFMRSSPVTPHIWNKYVRDDGDYVQRIDDTREWFYAHKEYIRFGPFVMEPCPSDALTEISFTSTSCTLIHRTVLEAMQKDPECGENWFMMDDDYTGGGEDRRFFDLARRAGFPAYVDRSCGVGHLAGDIPISSAEFIAWDSVSTYNGTGEIK
jgi:hypothetical protein